MMTLTKLHDKGFVYGDIRDINLLVHRGSLASDDAKDTRVHWAGSVEEAKFLLR
jgi:hypothetical protein